MAEGCATIGFVHFHASRFACAALPLLACALLLGAGCGRRRPNVLLITLDTTRADRLGCGGWTNAVTPALDRLAREGVRFTAAEAVAPITLPSHATLLTGLLPPEHGLRDNNIGSLPADVPTIAESFRARGYRTGAVVAFLVLHPRYRLDRGFQSYDAPPMDADIQRLMETPPPLQDDGALTPYRRAGQIGDAALAWLRAGGRKPWFLWVHFYDPHTPLHWNRREVGAGLAHPYDAEVALMDQQVARLLRHLDESGEAERTLVVAVGDHGESLGEHGEPMHGFLLYESTLRVPLLVRHPGRIEGGRVCATPVSQVQLAPTLLELAGVSPTATLAAGWRDLKWLPPRAPGDAVRADSLAPWLTGQRPALPAMPCYGESDYPYNTFNWAPLRSLRQGRWKYVRAPRGELYDLAADPGEQHDLALARTGMVASLERALTELEDLMTPRESGEVTLTGHEQRVLASVGYIGGKPSRPLAEVDITTLPDPKEVIEASRLYGRLARLMEANRPGDEAVALATRLVTLSPGTAGFHAQMGFLRERRGEIAPAIAAFTRAVELNPTRADYLCHLGILRVWTGDTAGALATCRKAYGILEGKAGTPDSLLGGINSAALLAARRRELGVAGTLIEISATLDKRHPGWQHARAIVRLMEGGRQEALTMLRRLTREYPDYRPARDALRKLDGGQP